MRHKKQGQQYLVLKLILFFSALSFLFFLFLFETVKIDVFIFKK